MKRLLAAVLAVCMISGIVGCGKKPETGNASEASSTTAEKESAETTEKEESIEKWSGNLEIRRLKTIRKLYLLDSLVKNLNT